MNLRTLAFAACMICSLTIFAGNPTNPTSGEASNSVLSKLFISDYDNTLLFIDFEVMNSQFTQISIFQNDQVVFEEDLSDLPSSTIYEVNLDQLNKSNTYVLKLDINRVTSSRWNKFSKKVVILVHAFYKCVESLSFMRILLLKARCPRFAICFFLHTLTRLKSARSQKQIANSHY